MNQNCRGTSPMRSKSISRGVVVRFVVVGPTDTAEPLGELAGTLAPGLVMER